MEKVQILQIECDLIICTICIFCLPEFDTYYYGYPTLWKMRAHNFQAISELIPGNEWAFNR